MKFYISASQQALQSPFKRNARDVLMSSQVRIESAIHPNKISPVKKKKKKRDTLYNCILEWIEKGLSWKNYDVSNGTAIHTLQDLCIYCASMM